MPHTPQRRSPGASATPSYGPVEPEQGTCAPGKALGRHQLFRPGPSADLSWGQRAALRTALVHPAGHVPAAAVEEDLQILEHLGLIEPIAPDGTYDPGLALAARWVLSAAGRIRAAATPRPRLIVVPCSMRKSGQAVAPAGEMYTGSYHLAARKAAFALCGEESRPLILSAKYGLLRLEDRILDYDLKAGQAGTVTAAGLRRQAHHLAVSGCRTTVLAGKQYAEIARHVWPDLHHPLAGARGIGDHLSYFAVRYGAGPRTAGSGPGLCPQARPTTLDTGTAAADQPSGGTVTYAPDTVAVRRLATQILLDHTRDIDFMSIGEAISGTPDTAGLDDEGFEALQRAVDDALHQATVQVSWPAEAA
ncbi:DUF6884 domain-containing protein [Streptomyces sp. NPDC090741]|uniref:DUF6884 domain-containing protein n=1 Tax=Streptomyces sp. NPDC090741 TaxID=3365967 RepID=UPI00381DD525